MAGIGDYEGVGSFTMPGWSGWVNDPKAKKMVEKDSPTDFNAAMARSASEMGNIAGGPAAAMVKSAPGMGGGGAMRGLGGVL